MKTVTILKGLPASGKSTWAKQQIDKHPGRYTRVNKDDLRAMMDNGKWSKSNEKLVLKIRNKIINKALDEGRHVLVDDTNLHPKHEETIRELVRGKATVQVKFFEISPEEAIKRDLKRENTVGERVIMDMYNQFLRPEPEEYLYGPDLEHAIICDIDGTIAHSSGRGWYDWDRVDEDDIDLTILNLLNALKDDYHIIMMSGRSSDAREKTEQWLAAHNVPYRALYMRASGDMRKDSVVKRELFDNHVRGNFAIQFVLDDRDQVVDEWRQMGLKCLQVAPGDF